MGIFSVEGYATQLFFLIVDRGYVPVEATT